MYKLLIVEDERIERESLVSMIQTFDLLIETIWTAENGEIGLQLYYDKHPDISLTDIDMPLLEGLDMIECIRKKDSKVTCLVLTSYDYFSYAQRAIRLNVEDFVLKPIDAQGLSRSLTQAVETITRNQNTYAQTSTLVQKMNEMKTLLESECFYAILTKRNECKIQETFHLAGIRASSCCCILFNEGNNVALYLHQARQELEDLGYICVQGAIHHQHILFILNNHKMDFADESLILTTLQKDDNTYEWSLGKAQNELSEFY